MIEAYRTRWHSLLHCKSAKLDSLRQIKINYLQKKAVTCITCMMFFLLLASCGNNEQQVKKENIVEDDSLQTVKSIVSEDSVVVFRNNANNWIGESIQAKGLNWNRFHLAEFWSDDS